MDEILLIVVLVVLAVFVLPIIALVKTSGLRREIEKLKSDVRALKREQPDANTQQAHSNSEKSAGLVTSKSIKSAVIKEPPVVPRVVAPEVPPEDSSVVTSATTSPVTKGLVTNKKIPAEDVQANEILSQSTQPDTRSYKALQPTSVKEQKPSEPTFFDRMIENVKENWLIWLGGLSLAVGGLYIVQYGIERGFLGPLARVLTAVGFGALLIFAAEWLRRKQPNQQVGFYTVSVMFASGGIATLFGAAVSAHLMYGFTSASIGFLSMVAVAFVAIAGGLIYGPVLAVIGILGAFVSPLLVDGGGPNPILFAYFLVILLAALFVERIQKWIWLSTLGVAGTVFWGYILHYSDTSQSLLGFYALGIIILTTCIPAFGFPPKNAKDGWVSIRSFLKISSHYPTVLAVLTTVVSTLLIVMASEDSTTLWKSSLLILTALFALSMFTNRRAQNLDQYALIFAVGILGLITNVASKYAFVNIQADRTDILAAYFPYIAGAFTAVLIASLANLVLRLQSSRRPMYWSTLTAGFPLVSFPICWLVWGNTTVASTLWPNLWVVSAVGVSAYLAGVAYICATSEPTRLKAEQTPNAFWGLNATDFSATSAFLMLGFSAFMAFEHDVNSIGLTLAFSGLSACTYLAAQRFGLKLTALLSVLFTGLALGRLMVVPGLWWAISDEATLTSILSVFATSIFIWFVAYLNAKNTKQNNHMAQFETAGIAAVAGLVITLISKWAFNNNPPTYAFFGLLTTVFLIFTLVQFRRRDLIDDLKIVRSAMGYLYLGLAALSLFVALVFGPLVQDSVVGLFPVDSLVLSYLLPAVILVSGLLVKQIPKISTSKICLGVAAALASWTLVLEIRRFWHGPEISVDFIGSTPLVLKAELYTYTIAMLLAMAGIIFMSVLKKNAMLKRIGLALALVTAAKVFFWDAAGLQGLGRATAFIILGLTLAGLATFLQRFGKEEPEQ